MIVAVFFYSLIFFSAASVYLKTFTLDRPLITIILVLLAAVWAALLAVSLALASQPGTSSGLILSVAAALIIAGLLVRAYIPATVAALVVILSLTLARQWLRREIVNRIVFNVRHIFTHGTRVIIIGLIVALAALAWPYVTSEVVVVHNIGIPEEQVEALLRPMAPVIANFLPGYHPDAVIDEIIQNQIEQRFPGLEISPAQIIEARQDFAKTFGRPLLTGRETVAHLVAGLINQQLRGLAQKSPWLLAVIVLAVVVLVFRALAPFVVWPVLFVISGLVTFYRRIGLVFLSRSQATIERLHY